MNCVDVGITIKIYTYNFEWLIYEIYEFCNPKWMLEYFKLYLKNLCFYYKVEALFIGL